MDGGEKLAGGLEKGLRTTVRLGEGLGMLRGARRTRLGSRKRPRRHRSGAGLEWAARLRRSSSGELAEATEIEGEETRGTSRFLTPT
jgi:hypothetical protein